MKKNLISVIILALVLTNLVLTALLIFSVLPQTKKANQLIEKVCKAIDLDLNSGAASGTTNIPVDKRESWLMNGGEKLTVTLAKGDNNKQAYAVIVLSFTMNKDSEGYSKYGSETLTKQDSDIKGAVNKILARYTIDDYQKYRDTKISEEILTYMQEIYGADFIVGVSFTESLVQQQ